MLRILCVVAMALPLILGGCGGSGGDNTPPSGETSRETSHVIPWRNNSMAEDLLDHWNQPEALQQAMSLSTVGDAEIPARKSALEALLGIAASDPAITGTRFRNVRAEDVEIVGERDGITFGRWTDGPAGTLNIEFDWRFAAGLNAAARARMERAGKAWSRRLQDDFGPNTVVQGTTIEHSPVDPGAESRTVTFEEDVPVDDVLIAVLYTGTSSPYSTGGPQRAKITSDDYEPWLGAIVLSRRHINLAGVMAHEIGHVIGLTDLSYDWLQSARRYVDFQNHTFNGPESKRANGGKPVPFQSSGSTIDYSHFAVCSSIMSHCSGDLRIQGPSELDFAFLSDIGYDVLDAGTASEPEVYGYGAWGRYSAWGAGAERDLDPPGGRRDALRAGADAFGIHPVADFTDAHQGAGSATWLGSLLGVDLGRAMLPPVVGDAALHVELSSHTGTARFSDLVVLVDGTASAFRAPHIEYAIDIVGNTFVDEEQRIAGGFFGPAHEEMAGVVDDRTPEVNLLAGFGGTR